MPADVPEALANLLQMSVFTPFIRAVWRLMRLPVLFFVVVLLLFFQPLQLLLELLLLLEQLQLFPEHVLLPKQLVDLLDIITSHFHGSPSKIPKVSNSIRYYTGV